MSEPSLLADSHKVVYVVSYMPSFEGAATAGFDWYATEDRARRGLIDALQRELGGDWYFDYTLRSMLVPRGLDSDGITALLSEQAELREVALPAEWDEIRGTGGAVDLTKGPE